MRLFSLHLRLAQDNLALPFEKKNTSDNALTTDIIGLKFLMIKGIPF